MGVTCKRENFADGINFLSLSDKKFNTNVITVKLFTSTELEKISALSLAFRIIQASNDKLRTRTELTARLAELYGAALSVNISKVGDNHMFSLSVSCICDRFALDGEKITDKAAEVLLDCLFRPYLSGGAFEESTFNIIKNDQIKSIKNKISDKRSYAVSKATEVLCEGEPYSVPADGTVESVEKLDPKRVYEEYKKLLSEGQIEISAAGGGNFDGIREMLRTEFKKIERRFKPVEFLSVSPLKEKPARECEKMDVLQSKMVMGFKAPRIDKEVMQLFCVMFGGSPTSKLFMNVREKLSLCYYCAANSYVEKSMIIVDSGVEKENTEKAENEILKQLSELAAGSFSDDELTNAKLSVIDSLKGMNDNASALASWWSSQYCVWNTQMSPEEAVLKYKAITREQITEAAKKFKLDSVYVLESDQTGGDEQ